MAKKMSRSASLNNLFRTTLLMILQNTMDPARMANMTSGMTIAFCRLSIAIACEFGTADQVQRGIIGSSQSA
jgi:hypothetical protein